VRACLKHCAQSPAAARSIYQPETNPPKPALKAGAGQCKATRVSGTHTIDGTPILDLKIAMREAPDG
jgi:hypothetical protein